MKKYIVTERKEPVFDAEDHEAMKHLGSPCSDCLSYKESVALHDRYINWRSYSEIGKALNCSSDVAYKLVKLAKAKILCSETDVPEDSYKVRGYKALSVHNMREASKKLAIARKESLKEFLIHNPEALGLTDMERAVSNKLLVDNLSMPRTCADLGIDASRGRTLYDRAKKKAELVFTGTIVA